MHRHAYYLYYKMKIKRFEFNPLGVNTYVLYDETSECIIIDAACVFPGEQKALVRFIEENDLTVTRLINTHMHFDHLFGVNFAADKYGLKLEANKEDMFLLETLESQLQMFGFDTAPDYKPEIGNFLTEEDVITFGRQELKILHIPGHSPGSLVFYNEKAGTAIVGDVLFNGSIGRTDLDGGNFDLLIGGIKTKLFALPDETVIYPGHGPKSTIEREKKHNPFVGDNY